MEVFLIASTDYEINEEIRDRELRLISENGEQLGIMSADKALDIAHEAGLDLVKVAPRQIRPCADLSITASSALNSPSARRRPEKAACCGGKRDSHVSGHRRTRCEC